MKRYLKRHIYLPQDHGSWVFILSPLLIGAFAGRTFRAATAYLFVAAMCAFLIRQPITVAFKIWSGRRAAAELPVAQFWIMFYGAIAFAALVGLVFAGYGYILYLAVPGAPVFAWHLWLVSKRAERRQINVEVVATGVLALSAPAAYWVGVQDYNPTGWRLWLFAWLQSSASIVYAYLRLAQREMKRDKAEAMTPADWRKLGFRALLYTSFNVVLTIGAGAFGLIPFGTFAPFLLQWLETVWGVSRPAVGWNPIRIGVRQLIVSTLWTVLFILVWR
ncbi:MAG: YwiC-like family protein [Anaerolineales bacterium]|nr:YwiC-like family protein [Anaerolineales bacterium]